MTVSWLDPTEGLRFCAAADESAVRRAIGCEDPEVREMAALLSLRTGAPIVVGAAVRRPGEVRPLYRFALIEPEVERTISLITVPGRPFSPAVETFVRAAHSFTWPG